jgi:signal transduction histidine kinase
LSALPGELRYLEIRALSPQELQKSSLASDAQSVILTVRDITANRSIEAHLLEGQKLDSLGQFVVGVAHSFSNALTAIAGYAGVARELESAEERQEVLISIQHTTQEAGVLLRQLLEFADGRPGIMCTEEIGRLVSARLGLFQKILGTSCHIEFHNQLPRTGIPVECDCTLVTQAITNLLIHARDAYGSTPGVISLSLSEEILDETVSLLQSSARPGRYARIQIKDTASGINPEARLLIRLKGRSILSHCRFQLCMRLCAPMMAFWSPSRILNAGRRLIFICRGRHRLLKR